MLYIATIRCYYMRHRDAQRSPQRRVKIMNTVTYYALIQIGHCIMGVGASEQDARDDAAQWMDGGEEEAEKVENFSSTQAMRHSCNDGDLAIVPCTLALFEKVQTSGTCTFEEKDGVICLPEEADE